MTEGDLVPVEIAGTEVGTALVTEITDDYIEVIYGQRTYKLPPDIEGYLELRRVVEGFDGQFTD